MANYIHYHEEMRKRGRRQYYVTKVKNAWWFCLQVLAVTAVVISFAIVYMSFLPD